MCTTDEDEFRVDRSKLPDGVTDFVIAGFVRGNDYVIEAGVGFLQAERWSGLSGTLAVLPPRKLYEPEHNAVMARNKYQRTGKNSFQEIFHDIHTTRLT